jgi:hypothetical protein
MRLWVQTLILSKKKEKKSNGLTYKIVKKIKNNEAKKILDVGAWPTTNTQLDIILISCFWQLIKHSLSASYWFLFRKWLFLPIKYAVQIHHFPVSHSHSRTWWLTPVVIPSYLGDGDSRIVVQGQSRQKVIETLSREISWAWGCMPVIPCMWEVYVEGSQPQATGQKTRLSLKKQL